MRLSILFVLSLFFVNSGVAAADAAGVFNDIGIDPDGADHNELDKAQSTAEDFDTGPGGGDTLFGLYSTLAGVLETIFLALNPAAEMAINYGAPKVVVNWLLGPLEVIAGLDIIGFLRSGGLTQ